MTLDDRSWQQHITIMNKANGLRVTIGYNKDNLEIGSIGYILRHGFYQGGGRTNAYRIDPEVLVAVLTGQEATAALRQKESLTLEALYELRRKKEMEANLTRERAQVISDDARTFYKTRIARLTTEQIQTLWQQARARKLDYKISLFRFGVGFAFFFEEVTTGDIYDYANIIVQTSAGREEINLIHQADILKEILVERGEPIDAEDDLAANHPGGVDFNPANMDLRERGPGMDFILDHSLLTDIPVNAVEGVAPVIINIVPIVDFSPLLGRAKEREGDPQLFVSN